MMRRVNVFAATSLAAALLVLPTVFSAAADPEGDAPAAGDPRATSHAGNVTTCAAAGLSGTVILKDDSPTAQYLTIAPAEVPAGYTVTGIVIKAGNGYNVYPPQYRSELHGPLVGQDKNVPAISHWFVCGQKTDESTTSSPRTEPPPGTESSTAGTSAPVASSPAAQGGVVSDDELAATGTAPATLLIAGAMLVLMGGGLLVLLRRTRRS